MSLWVLVGSYWLHMAATVLWIGGLFFQAIVIPLSLSSAGLSPSQQASLLEGIRKRFDPLAWLSLFVLVGTGLVQMSANSKYEGLLSVTTQWASALLLKHIAVLFMLIVAAAQTWVIQPRINRLMLRIARAEAPSGEMESIFKRHRRLSQINFILAVVVLGFTALARSS